MSKTGQMYQDELEEAQELVLKMADVIENLLDLARPAVILNPNVKWAIDEAEDILAKAKL